MQYYEEGNLKVVRDDRKLIISDNKKTLNLIKDAYMQDIFALDKSIYNEKMNIVYNRYNNIFHKIKQSQYMSNILSLDNKYICFNKDVFIFDNDDKTYFKYGNQEGLALGESNILLFNNNIFSICIDYSPLNYNAIRIVCEFNIDGEIINLKYVDIYSGYNDIVVIKNHVYNKENIILKFPFHFSIKKIKDKLTIFDIYNMEIVQEAFISFNSIKSQVKDEFIEFEKNPLFFLKRKFYEQ